LASPLDQRAGARGPLGQNAGNRRKPVAGNPGNPTREPRGGAVCNQLIASPEPFAENFWLSPTTMGWQWRVDWLPLALAVIYVIVVALALSVWYTYG